MAKIAIATLQPVWDCRWSRPAPQRSWVCTFNGLDREIDARECEECPHWEPRWHNCEHTAARSSDTAAVAVAVPDVQQLGDIAARALLIVAALISIAVGVVILDGPLAVPMTLALWLSAGAMVGLAVFARLAG